MYLLIVEFWIAFQFPTEFNVYANYAAKKFKIQKIDCILQTYHNYCLIFKGSFSSSGYCSISWNWTEDNFWLMISINLVMELNWMLTLLSHNCKLFNSLFLWGRVSCSLSTNNSSANNSRKELSEHPFNCLKAVHSHASCYKKVKATLTSILILCFLLVPIRLISDQP